MQIRKSKADQTVEGICIILSNISKATAFLYQGITIVTTLIEFQKFTADQILYRDPQPRSQGSLLLVPWSSRGRVGENPGNEVAGSSSSFLRSLALANIFVALMHFGLSFSAYSIQKSKRRW